MPLSGSPPSGWQRRGPASLHAQARTPHSQGTRHYRNPGIQIPPGIPANFQNHHPRRAPGKIIRTGVGSRLALDSSTNAGEGCAGGQQIVSREGQKQGVPCLRGIGMERLGPVLSRGRVKSPPRGASGSRRLLLGSGWVGRRGFGSRRGFCHWIRSIVLFNDVSRDLDIFGSEVHGNLCVIQDQCEPIFRRIFVNNLYHLYADPVDDLVPVMVEVVLCVLGRSLQKLLLLFRVTAETSLLFLAQRCLLLCQLVLNGLDFLLESLELRLAGLILLL